MDYPLSLIEKLLQDPDVSEILIDGWQNLYIEKQGTFVDVPGIFKNEAQLLDLVQAIAEPLGRRVDESHPLLDMRLADGSRVNIAMPPISLIGPVVTIRKFFKREVITFEKLIEWGSLSKDIADFMRICVLGRLNIAVAGGTGSGKTTLLHVIARLVPADERIIVLQMVEEFKLPQTRVVPLEYRPPNLEGRGEISLRDLVQNALRMRPDRIILTEARGEEMLDFLAAMNSGHDGCLLSLHAGNVHDALARLETMAGMGNPTIPLLTLREQIASALNLIVYLERMQDGVRRITRISEVTGVEDGVVRTKDLFEFRRTGTEKGRIQGIHTATGYIPDFLITLRQAGFDVPVSIFTPM